MIFLLLFISSFLLCATVMIEYSVRRHPSAEAHQNRLRVFAWWGMFAFCAVIFSLGGWWLSLFILLLAIQAGREVGTLHSTQFTFWHGLLIFFITLGFLISVHLYEWQLYYLLVACILTFVSLTSAFVGRAHLTLVMIVILSSLVSMSIIGQFDDGGYLLLLIFFITACNDVAQYVGGKLFGKIPLAPKASPNKSVEGALTGIIVTSILALCFFEFSWYFNLLCGCLIGGAGILGDLHISALKRRAKVKDSGNLIPGHGGLLDRLDSLLFTVPVFGLLMKVIA